MGQVLDDLFKLNERDYQVVSIHECSKPEQALLNIVVMIIEKDEKEAEYDKEKHEVLFVEHQEFYEILKDRRKYEFNDACFKKLKDFITKSSPTDYPKPIIFKALYNYLSELYRKLNVRNTMSQQFN